LADNDYEINRQEELVGENIVENIHVRIDATSVD
jgi:hypothetical protein